MRRVNVRLCIDEEREDIDVLLTAPARDEQIDDLITRIEDPLAGTLVVLDAQGTWIPLAEDLIVSISADNKRLQVRTEDGSYWLRTSLQRVEGMLNPVSFLRISRYEIINLRMVRSFDFTVAGTLRIDMADGSETWASRRYISTIKSRLQRKE